MVAKKHVSRDLASVLKARLTQRGLRRYVSADATHAARITGTYVDEKGRLVKVLLKRKPLTPQAERRETRNIGIWQCVNREIHSLICTQNAKYATLRRMLASKEYKASQKAVCYLIAGTIAIHVGFTAVILFPFVALALAAVLKVGKNVYCRRFRPQRRRKRN
jgi:hypothetical protein